MPDLEVCDGSKADGPPAAPGRGYHALAFSHTHTATDGLALQTPRETADQSFGGQALELFSLVSFLVFWALAPHLGHASVQDWSMGMFAANALGLVGAGSLHLAFLSPAAWRRWIAERAAS